MGKAINLVRMLVSLYEGFLVTGYSAIFFDFFPSSSTVLVLLRFLWLGTQAFKELR